MKAIIGRKVGMMSIYDENGKSVPVTLVQADPCIVTQVKTAETDGYNAVQLGYGDAKHQPKPQQGHLKASKSNAKKLKEFRTSEEDEFKVGDTLDVNQFEVGEKIDVVGTSKGKGFAGTVKRYNFAIGPKSHGGRNKRQPGSIGSMYPQKVFKGKKMPGRMGGEQVTVKNLEIALIEAEDNVIGLRGAVPGPKKSLVTIKERVF